MERSSEVSLSIFEYISMETFHDNNIMYYVEVQGIDLPKTSTYQGLCIYPERELFLYDWYWSMEYTCVMDRINVKFIFSKFSITVFKSGEARIYFKLSL